MIRRDAYLKTGAAFAFATGAFWAFTNLVPYSLVWNHTASLPIGLYLSEDTAHRAVPVGAMACFAYHAPAWANSRHYFYEGVSLCKYVKGLAGDVLLRKNGEWVALSQTGDARRVGAMASRDHYGRALPQDALKEGPIPPGMVVMSAPQHSNSLDSRYLGLVAQDALRTRIYPLITW